MEKLMDPLLNGINLCYTDTL